jgi:hypothetical protein
MAQRPCMVGLGRLWPVLLVLAAAVLVSPRTAAAQPDLETYRDPAYGWSVAYDPAEWQHDTRQNATVFASEEAGFVYFWVDPGEENDGEFAGDVDACLAAIDHPEIADPTAVDEDDLPRPGAPDDGEGALVRDEVSGWLAYRACAPLGAGSRNLLVVDWTVDGEDAYAGGLSLVSDLIAAIELPAGGGNGGGGNGGGSDDDPIVVELIGRVTDAETGDPLAQAVMVVLELGQTTEDFNTLDHQAGRQEGVLGDGVTDEDGAFSFEVEIEINAGYTAILYHADYEEVILWEDLVIADDPTINQGNFGEIELRKTV